MPRFDGVSAGPLSLAVLAVLGLSGAGCRYLVLPEFSTEPPPAVAERGPAVDDPWELAPRPELLAPVAPAFAGATERFARVRLLALPSGDVLPRGDQPIWVFAPSSDQPLEPAPRFTAGLAAGWTEERLEGELRGAADLALATDCNWAIAVRSGGADAVTLYLWIDRSGGPAGAIAAAGEVPALVLGQEQAAAVGAIDGDLWEQRSGNEYAPLPNSDGKRVLWCRVPTIGAGALVVEIEFEDAPEQGPEGLAFQRALADVRAVLAAGNLEAPPPPLLRAALDRPEQRRALLVELARTTSRTLLLDLVLLADAEALEAWTKEAAAGVPQGATPSEQALAVARAAILALSRDADADRIDVSLEALLLVHLGALGGEPGILGDVVRRTATSDELAKAVESENLLLLDDPRPIVRVRALRWLRERGAGPTEFDPLAARDVRRVALDNWRRAREAAGATP